VSLAQPPILTRLWQALVCVVRPNAPQLHPLQILGHTYMYSTDFITMHAATSYFGLLGGRNFK